MPGIAEHAVPGINVCAESDDVDISDVDIVVRRVGVCRMKISTVMRCAQCRVIHDNELSTMVTCAQVCRKVHKTVDNLCG